MATYEIKLPGGAVYDVEAESEQQLQVVVAQLTGASPLTPERPIDPSAGGGTLSFGPWDTGIRTPRAVDRALAGVGKFLTDTALGIEQLAAPRVADKVDPRTGAPLYRETGVERLRAAADEKKRIDAPLMATTAGKAGNIGGALAFTVPLAFVPGANTYAGSVLLGGALGATSPVGTDESRALNIALGGAGGAAGKFLGDRIASAVTRPHAGSGAQSAASATASTTGGGAGARASVQANPTVNVRSAIDYGIPDPSAPNGLTTAQREAMAAGRRVGMRLTPGQATGNRSLQRVEAKLESQPMTSGTFDAIKRNNERALVRSFLKEIGEDGNELTGEVIARADSRIGDVFEQAAQQNRTLYDDTLQSALSDVEQAASRELSSGDMGVIRRQLENILEKAAGEGGAIDGRTFQNIRMGLTRLSGNANASIGYWARQMRSALDEALIRSVGPEQAGALVKARDQYRILETALGRNAINIGAGKISPGILASALAQGDRAGYLLGGRKSPLYDALRFSQAFQPLVGDSGTATRMPLGLMEAAVSLPIRLATGAYASTPGVNLAVGAQAGSNAVGAGTRAALAPVAPYLQRGLIPAGGLFAPYLSGQ